MQSRGHAVEQARLATQRQRPDAQRQDPTHGDGIHVIPHRRLAARLLQDPLDLRGASKSEKRPPTSIIPGDESRRWREGTAGRRERTLPYSGGFSNSGRFMIFMVPSGARSNFASASKLSMSKPTLELSSSCNSGAFKMNTSSLLTFATSLSGCAFNANKSLRASPLRPAAYSACPSHSCIWPPRRLATPAK